MFSIASHLNKKPVAFASRDRFNQTITKKYIATVGI
jgi:hypothetical protein